MPNLSDLIYDFGLKEVFRKQYPAARIEDDDDDIHGQRFTIELPDGVTREDYFGFLILNPEAAAASLHFGLTIAMPKKGDVEMINKLVAYRESQKPKES